MKRKAIIIGAIFCAHATGCTEPPSEKASPNLSPKDTFSVDGIALGQRKSDIEPRLRNALCDKPGFMAGGAYCTIVIGDGGPTLLRSKIYQISVGIEANAPDIQRIEALTVDGDIVRKSDVEKDWGLSGRCLDYRQTQIVSTSGLGKGSQAIYTFKNPMGDIFLPRKNGDFICMDKIGRIINVINGTEVKVSSIGLKQASEEHRQALEEIIDTLSAEEAATRTAGSAAPTAPILSEPLLYRNAPRPYSVLVPRNWIMAPNMTANTRASFSSPSTTPLANCAVTAIVFEGQSLTQDEISQNFQSPLSAPEMEQNLSASYNNVRVLNITRGLLSGYPAWIVKFEGSVGGPHGENWIVMVSTITAVAPNVTWQVGCGGTGGSLSEARAAFNYWQSDMALFPKNFRLN